MLYNESNRRSTRVCAAGRTARRVALLCGLLLLTLLLTVSCYPSNESSNVEAAQDTPIDLTEAQAHRCFCSMDTFKSVADNWLSYPENPHYGTDIIHAKSLNKARVNSLTAQMTYYFVFSFLLPNVGDYEGTIRFSDFTDDVFSYRSGNVGIRWGEVLVSHDFIRLDMDKGDVKISLNAPDDYANILAYVAIPITPTVAGMVTVTSTIAPIESDPTDARGVGAHTGAFTAESSVLTANVLPSGDGEAKDLSYYASLEHSLLDEASALSGLSLRELEEQTDLYEQNKLVMGRNFLAINGDLTISGTASGEVKLVLLLYKSEWQNLNVEVANTAKIRRVETEDAVIMEFTYTLSSDGNKSPHIILSFDVTGECPVDLRYFCYSGDTESLGGTVYCASYLTPDVMEPMIGVDYCNGYAVVSHVLDSSHYSHCRQVVPGFYEGFPVLVLEADALGEQKEVAYLHLGRIESLDESVFKGNRALMAIHPGYAITEIPEYFFADCTSLREVYFPGNLCYIGVNVFTNCYALEKVYFAETVGWTDCYNTPKKLDDPAENAANMMGQNDSYFHIQDD